jgi:hypothetical protein
MLPVLVLAVIAFGFIKSLMWVVARDEAAGSAPRTRDVMSPAIGDLTVELRATVNDDVRAFLLPSVAEPSAFEPAAFEHAALEHDAVDVTSFVAADTER